MRTPLLLRASGAHRWTECIASALPTDHKSDESVSIAALRGNAIHAIAATLLFQNLSKSHPKAKILFGAQCAEPLQVGDRYTMAEHSDRHSIKVNQSMWRMAECYTQDVLEWLKSLTISVEAMTIDHSFIVPLTQPNGQALEHISLSVTPDFMVFGNCAGKYTASCIDLKTGTFPVKAFRNAQLMTYLAYSSDIANVIFNTKHITLSSNLLYSCAIWSSKSFEWWSPSALELLDWRKNVVERGALDIASGNVFATATQHGCYFCTHKSNCDTYTAYRAY